MLSTESSTDPIPGEIAERAPGPMAEAPGFSHPELELREVSYRTNGVSILTRVSFQVPPGVVAALVGPNGSGKTTVFNVATGRLRPTSGSVFLRSSDVTRLRPCDLAQRGVGRLFQEVRVFSNLAAVDNVDVAFGDRSGAHLLSALFGSRWRFEDAPYRASAIAELAKVDLAAAASQTASTLSFGQQKLLALATLLASRPSILLLDEPTAGLAPQLVVRILERIRGFAAAGGTVLLIEHDLDLVHELCDVVFVLDGGKLAAEGPPARILRGRRSEVRPDQPRTSR